MSASEPASTGRLRRVGTVVLAAAALFVLAMTLLPASSLAVWATQRFGIAHAVAFPLLTGAGLLLLGSLGAVMAMRRRSPPRAPLAWAAPLALAGLVLILHPQGTPSPAAAPPGGRQMTVAVYNSQDTLTAADLRKLETAYSPDVFVFPEAGGARVTEAAKSAGLTGTVLEPRDSGLSAASTGSIAPTTLLLRDRFGEYRQTDPAATSFGSVGAAPANGEGPRPEIIGVHTAPPLPGLMENWRQDLGAISTDLTRGSGPRIIAGDFNATLRHGPLAGLQGFRDAASACPAGQQGTWPASAPGALAAPIDHVLISEQLSVIRCETLRLGQGDHRAVVVVLTDAR